MPQTIYARTTPPTLVTPATAFPNSTFVTFGGGTALHRRSAKALAAEVKRLGWFERVVCITDDVASPISTSLERDLGHFIHGHQRGYGLWIWKPYIIDKILGDQTEGLVVYADAGCEISRLGRHRFSEYVSFAQANDAALFSLPYLERDWTKPEALNFEEFCGVDPQSGQIQATWMVLSATHRTRCFVSDWLRLCSLKDFALLRDSSDCTVNHRHDQSVLSMLAKTKQFKTLPWEDHFSETLYFINSWILLYPIHTRRIRRLRIVYFLTLFSSISQCRKNWPASGRRLTVGLRISTRVIQIIQGLRQQLSRSK